MPLFLAKYISQKKKGKNYILLAENERAAFDKACPMQSYLGAGWKLNELFSVEDNTEAEIFPSIPKEYEKLYYFPKHYYKVMFVEGTRLLNIRDDKKSSSYGSLLRNQDTGETTYACANGEFFSHEEILKKKCMYFDETVFPWHPVVFPFAEKGVIDLPYYITSNFHLAIPIQFWGHASYDAQIKWLAAQEGLL